MIPLIQFDGKTNTPGEWEAGKKGVGVSAGGGGGARVGRHGDEVGEEDKRKKLEKRGGGVCKGEERGAEASSSRLKS